ncbi:MAG: DUF3466 family protein [Nitrospira sp.]
MKKNRSTRSPIHVAMLGLVLLAGNQAEAYEFFDLGTAGGPFSFALAVNNSNQSTGRNSRGGPTEDQGEVLTRWNGTAMQTFSDPNRYNGGWAINSSGVIAGGSSRSQFGFFHAAVFSADGTRTDLHDLGGATDPTDNRFSIAAGINDAGQIVGRSVAADRSATKAVLWDNSVDPTVLPTLGGEGARAHDINNAGQVVGRSALTGDAAEHATLWTLSSGDIVDLGTLGGTSSEAWAINEAGVIAGWSEITGDGEQHASLWSGSAITDLGTLGGNSQALALNLGGSVVGWSELVDGSRRATLWNDGQILDLNSLLDPTVVSAGWVLQQASGINDQGWIVGRASNSQLGLTDTHAFLLTPTPVPVPAAMWLFGTGLAGLAGLARRRTRTRDL